MPSVSHIAYCETFVKCVVFIGELASYANWRSVQLGGVSLPRVPRPGSPKLVPPSREGAAVKPLLLRNPMSRVRATPPEKTQVARASQDD